MTKEITQEQWNKWYCHKSGKEKWIEHETLSEKEQEAIDLFGDEYGA